MITGRGRSRRHPHRSFRPTPTEPRHAATWLTVRDGVTLLRAAAPMAERFLTVYDTSDNPLRWWPREGWEWLGYHPVDTAADHPLPTPVGTRSTSGSPWSASRDW